MIVWCLKLFQHYFSYVTVANKPCSLEFLLTVIPHNILWKPQAVIPHNHLKTIVLSESESYPFAKKLAGVKT